ncbi:MAG: nucleotide sugar dehydrogenase [Dehalococcoidia bacterium]|nr:nucleotide sugar dehydrogenase [Dehalococcoidia bacterium]
MDAYRLTNPVVCIVGLGYVGLPLAEAFSRSLKVIGFDTNAQKVKQLKNLQHANRESVLNPYTQTLSTPNSKLQTNLIFTADAKEIGKGDFIIIAVPTPVTKSKAPDLSYVKNAAGIVGQNMKKDCVIILESTVYPGVTEEIVKPILEKESSLKCGTEFSIAYSPERINPGDAEHTPEKITKVVAGMDEKITELVAELYGKITANIFRARNIKTAEAAKVIENIQRDLNIALMNELSLIFDKMGLNTSDVLDAAATKWNFHRYSPGLVGGHCIPVDPYYLVYKARDMGYHSQVILSGRAINDSMPKHVAEMTIKALNDAGKVIKGSTVLIMGLTYKENVSDTRETPVKGIIKNLKEYGVNIFGCDPLLNNIEAEFGIKPYDFQLPTANLQPPAIDCIILAVVHDTFKQMTLADMKSIMSSNPILIDIRGSFNPATAESEGICYRSL